MRTLKYVIGAVSFSLLLVFACSKPATLNTDNSISAIQVLDNGSDITATLKSLTIGTTADASGNYPIAFTLPAGAKVENLTVKYTINPKAKLVTDLTNLKYKANTPTLIEVQSESKVSRKYYVTISMEEVKASTKQITSFIFKKAENTALLEDNAATIAEATKTITVTLPYGTVVTSLKPTIEHDGISVKPLSGVAQDFTAAVSYEVTAQDGTKQAYTVTVTPASISAKSITSFKFTKTDNTSLTEDYIAKIDPTAKTISVTLPYGTVVTSLKPTIEHNGKSIDPQSGLAKDFTNEVSYSVTAQDNSKQTYKVKVTVADNKAPSKPELTSPVNDVKDLDRNQELTFTWSASTDPQGSALSYSINIYNADPTTGDPITNTVAFTEITEGISFKFGSKKFDYGKPFYWEIVAKNDLNFTTKSELWKFTTKANQAPTMVTLNLPANNAMGVDPSAGKFVWTQSTDPENSKDLSYTLYLGTTNPPTENVFKDGSKLEAGFLKVSPNTPLKVNTPYYWFIKVEDGEGGSSQTPVSSFTTSTVGISINGYYETDKTRIGAGDMTKTGLIQIAIADGVHNYSINGISGTFTSSNGLGTINGQLGFFKTGDAFIADGLMKITIDGTEYDLGTKEQYKVRTAADLSAVRLDLVGSYTMMNDITLPPVDGTAHLELADDYATKGWEPIGTKSTPYKGVFDGGGYIISNLNIKRPNTEIVALFSYLDGTITKVAIHGGLVDGYKNVGTLVCRLNQNSTVTNCYSSCEVVNSVYNELGVLGGLIAISSGYVENCYVIGKINIPADFIIYGAVVGLIGLGFSPNYLYWDKVTTGLTTSAGSDASFGKTTAEMKMQSTYVVWDFVNVWGINPNINNGYPYLRNALRP